MKESVAASSDPPKEMPNMAASTNGSGDHSQSKRKCFQRIEFDKEGNVVLANSNAMSTRWDVQDFYKLRDDCVKNKQLFEDPNFPAHDSSIYETESARQEGQQEGTIVWKRPIQICEKPHFATDGISRFDIQLGRLKNSWLITALVSLTAHPTLFHRVVPRDNYETSGQAYAGIYHFRFWRYGQWYDVVIDDRLPTINDKLVYMHSTEPCEFWSALLEKAYAKLLGSYEALTRGSANEAMIDLTGGISESYGTKSDTKSLFAIMQCAGRSALVGGCINGGPVGTVTPQGLVLGYSYSITKAVTVQLDGSSQSIALVRLRSPMADGKEWNGDWSDESDKWRSVSTETRTSLGIVNNPDGEFWMCFDDFLKYFHRVDVCNLTVTHSTNANPDDAHAGWLETPNEGQWVKGVSAGGSHDFPDSHWTNPQYVIELKSSDGGGTGDGGRPYTLIVSLMQKERRMSRWLSIGFALYKIASSEPRPKPLPKEWFEYQQCTGCCAHKSRREATERFELEAGTYILIPSTNRPNQVGDFMLRVFSKAAIVMEENDCVSVKCVPESSHDELSKEIRTEVEKIFYDNANEHKELDWMRLKMALDEKYAAEIKKMWNGLTKGYKLNHTQSDVEARVKSSDGEFTASCRFQNIYGLFCCLPFLSNARSTVPGFSKDVCRMMIAMLDADDSGTLGKGEFLELIARIEQLKKDFNRFDKDRSDSLDSSELGEALKQSSDITLSKEILTMLVRRYSSKGDKIWFDDYIALVFKMRTINDHIIKSKGWKPNGELNPEMQKILLNLFKM